MVDGSLQCRSSSTRSSGFSNVGHSYGGGVALRAAIERPDRVASLSLYEPSAFHLLPALGERGAAAFAEIQAIVRQTVTGIAIGDYRGAAAAFVDYWGGSGTWAALRPSVQRALTRWVPKAPLDFTALIYEPTPLAAYARLPAPTLILRGQHAPTPSRMIAETLSTALPTARLVVVDGAGHMGPLSHPAAVNMAITGHIARVESLLRQPGPAHRSPGVAGLSSRGSHQAAS
jgi:pimeloyl-ACP methyl ester carboxylesterase